MPVTKAAVVNYLVVGPSTLNGLGYFGELIFNQVKIFFALVTKKKYATHVFVFQKIAFAGSFGFGL